jgi:hypothetical protein
LVVTFGYLDACFPGEGWDIVAHAYLQRAASGLMAAGESKQLPGPGLFSGTAGLAFAAWYVSRDGSRYQRLLGNLEVAITRQARTLANRVHDQVAGPVSAFDAVSGLSGLAAYLICRRGQPEVAVALNEVVRSLVALTVEAPVARWHTPEHLIWDEASRRISIRQPELRLGARHSRSFGSALLGVQGQCASRRPKGSHPADRHVASSTPKRR